MKKMKKDEKSVQHAPQSELSEAFLAFGIVVAVIAGLTHLSRFIPFLNDHIQWIAALGFIGLPWFFLKRRGVSLDSIGVHVDSWKAYFLPSLALCAIVFPLFIAGFHVVQTQFFEREYQDANLALFQEEQPMWLEWTRGPKPIQTRPERLGSKPIQLWEQKGSLVVFWSLEKGQRVQGKLSVDGRIGEHQPLIWRKAGLYKVRKNTGVYTKPDESTLQIEATRRGGLILDTHQNNSLDIQLNLNGKPISPSQTGLGEFNVQPSSSSPWTFNRGYLWLLSLLLMHILLVGVPEEAFYRGYLQSAFEKRFPSQWKIFGGKFGWAIVFTSVLFALGHFLIEFDPNRLIVFFPSLLFGWMKTRVKSIGSIAVFHGLCNVLLDILSRYYV